MMTRIPWIYDDEVEVRIELSESLELIARGLQTDYVFQPGGTVGVPFGWTPSNVGGPSSDVNFTTSGGRFSVSDKGGATNTNYRYGALGRTVFAVTPGKRYRVGGEYRTMEDKGNAKVQIDIDLVDQNGNPIAGTNQRQQHEPPQTWQTFTYTVLDVPAQATHVAVKLAGATAVQGTAGWGAQFQRLWLIDDSVPQPQKVWYDVTCDTRNVTTRYGRERFTSRYDVATAVIVLNNDEGAYTYRNNHPRNLGPGTLVRVRAFRNAWPYPLYYGIVDTLTDGYSLDGRAITTISCVDISTLLAQIKVPTTTVPGSSRPYAGDRIKQLVRVAGWSAYTMDRGVWITQEIDANNRSLREEIGITADSEGGEVFADLYGNIVYQDRTRVSTYPWCIQATADILAMPHDGALPDLGDVPNYSPPIPVVCARSMISDWSMARLVNYVELANAGSTTRLYEDVASQNRYGVHSYQRLDFVLDRNYSDTYRYLDQRAADFMNGYADAKLRINGVSFDATAAKDWVWTLSLFLNYCVRVWYAHPVNKWGYAIATRVQSIEHSITPNEWLVTLALDRPLAFTEVQFSEVGWDVALWDEALWDDVRV